MIQFQWELISDDRFQIKIKTPLTLVGTLHRLTAAMYALGMDVVSGNILTEEEHGELFTHDNFVLRVHGDSKEISLNESTARLGMLMETVLRSDQNPGAVLDERNIALPVAKGILSGDARIEFQTLTHSNLTRLHIETDDRRGLLYHVTRILAQHNINILNAVILTTDTGIAEDTLYLQFENAPLSEQLSEQIRIAFNQLSDQA